MPTIPRLEALERLARAVETATPDDVVAIYTELFPTKNPREAPPVAKQIAAHIRLGIEPEEIVDLWNVVFPAERSVYYNEEEGSLQYREVEPRYAET